MISQGEHDYHLAAAANNFRGCFGDERTWTPEVQALHDHMEAKIDVEDGYEPVVDGRRIVL